MSIKILKGQKINGVDYPAGIAIIGLDANVEAAAAQGGGAMPVNLAVVDASAVSGAWKSPAARPRIAFHGDSTTWQAIAALGQQIASSVDGSPGIGTSSFVRMWCDTETPSGAGTLTYSAAAKTLTWQAAGDTAGPPVDASKTGLLTVPSGTAGRALYLTWFGASRSYTSGTTTITVKADGFQIWSYASRALPVCALAAAGDRFDLAALPTALGCPPGMDGIYGLPGGTTAELIDAAWQTDQIVSDIDVLGIGTNDINGGASAATVAANIQTWVDRRIALGVSLVVVQTVWPRNADTATQSKRKQSVVNILRSYIATKQGRVVLWDAAGRVMDPATGQWLSGMSSDGIHPTAKSGTAVGYVLGDFLASVAPANQGPVPTLYGDVYDATENPQGNLLLAGMGLQVGSAGTAGAGASGQVSTGWTAARTSGAAMTLNCSKVPRTDGVSGEWQQVVLGSAAANEVGRLIPTLTSTDGLAAGGEYGLEVEVRIVACASLNRLNSKIVWNGVSARAPESFQGQGVDLHADINTPRTLWLPLPPKAKAPAGVTSAYWAVIEFGTAAGGSATIQVGRVRPYRIA